MIQIILKLFSMFCSFGGPWVAPFFMPIINIPLIISSFIPIMLSIMLSGPNVLNTNENGEKDWKKGSGWSFLIYYLIFFIISCSVLQSTCRVVS